MEAQREEEVSMKYRNIDKIIADKLVDLYLELEELAEDIEEEEPHNIRAQMRVTTALNALSNMADEYGWSKDQGGSA